ncbi:MAG: hypothetical protein H6Q14_497 [Bacteroidetes bacterium]|nr:hypothetical protein [Bacteroidota bacterium]
MEVIKKSDKVKQLAADLAAEAKKSAPKRPLFIRIIKSPVFLGLLLLIIVVLFAYLFTKTYFEKNSLEKEKIELVSQFKKQSDSIQLKNLEFSSMVFSWSVRNGILRNNMDNLDLEFNLFARYSGADLVQLITEENNIILISSDKKFQGGKFQIPLNIDLNKTTVVRDTSKTVIYTPIMGLNKRIGILRTELGKKEVNE